MPLRSQRDHAHDVHQVGLQRLSQGQTFRRKRGDGSYRPVHDRRSHFEHDIVLHIF